MRAHTYVNLPVYRHRTHLPPVEAHATSAHRADIQRDGLVKRLWSRQGTLRERNESPCLASTRSHRELHHELQICPAPILHDLPLTSTACLSTTISSPGPNTCRGRGSAAGARPHTHPVIHTLQGLFFEDQEKTPSAPAPLTPTLDSTVPPADRKTVLRP